MKETIESKYRETSKRYQNLLQQVLRYIKLTFNVDDNTLSADTYKYVKMALERLKASNNKVELIRSERKKIEDDLESLERSFVNADCLEPREITTTNNENTIYKRQILKLELKEQIFNSLLESRILEKSLLDNNRLISEYINIIPRQQYIEVLEMTYIKCMTNTQIAKVLNYSIDFVDQARKRGLKDLSSLLIYTKM